MPFSSRLSSMLVALLLALSAGEAQERPYIERGKRVEVAQKTLTDRVTRFHQALKDVLQSAVPDLIPRLDPPPPIATGYQLLPRVYPAGPPQRTPQPPQIISYGWVWSETLMGNETKALASLEDRLAHIPVAAGSRPALDSLVADYRSLVDRKKLVDADVNYNWLWQAEITRVPGIFARASKLQNAIIELHQLRALRDSARNSGKVKLAPGFDSVLAARSAFVQQGLKEDVERVDVPAFVRFASTGAAWRITVPVFTDIVDTAFVSAFKRAVEGVWQLRTDSASYAVEVQFTVIDPTTLYCGVTPPPACAPPARGAPIDLASHIARFPPGGAVLTTGAGTTHVTAARAIVVSPHDATTTLLAHEFGHLLGFRDAYLRGSVDAGSDGFIITELVVDRTDLMGNSGAGSVFPEHFTRLIAVKDVARLMTDGLAELYERKNAREAIVRFHEVLAKNPYHYGATVQLAKAYDAAGLTSEAVTQWRKVLEIAELAGDPATAAEARTHLTRGR